MAAAAADDQTNPEQTATAAAAAAGTTEPAKYGASHIKSLDDVEHVRTRPGMYIGGGKPRRGHPTRSCMCSKTGGGGPAGAAEHAGGRAQPPRIVRGRKKR